jgi:hypothetical protein
VEHWTLDRFSRNGAAHLLPAGGVQFGAAPAANGSAGAVAAGSAFYPPLAEPTSSLPCMEDVVFRFKFRLSADDYDALSGQYGLAFTVQRTGPNALGGQFGYSSDGGGNSSAFMPASFAVVFRTTHDSSSGESLVDNWVELFRHGNSNPWKSADNLSGVQFTSGSVFEAQVRIMAATSKIAVAVREELEAEEGAEPAGFSLAATFESINLNLALTAANADEDSDIPPPPTRRRVRRLAQILGGRALSGESSGSGSGGSSGGGITSGGSGGGTSGGSTGGGGTDVGTNGGGTDGGGTDGGTDGGGTDSGGTDGGTDGGGTDGGGTDGGTNGGGTDGGGTDGGTNGGGTDGGTDGGGETNEDPMDGLRAHAGFSASDAGNGVFEILPSSLMYFRLGSCAGDAFATPSPSATPSTSVAATASASVMPSPSVTPSTTVTVSASTTASSTSIATRSASTLVCPTRNPGAMVVTFPLVLAGVQASRMVDPSVVFRMRVASRCASGRDDTRLVTVHSLSDETFTASASDINAINSYADDSVDVCEVFASRRLEALRLPAAGAVMQRALDAVPTTTIVMKITIPYLVARRLDAVADAQAYQAQQVFSRLQIVLSVLSPAVGTAPNAANANNPYVAMFLGPAIAAINAALAPGVTPLPTSGSLSSILSAIRSVIQPGSAAALTVVAPANSPSPSPSPVAVYVYMPPAKTSNTGKIVGAVLGTLAALAVIVLAVFLFIGYRKRQQKSAELYAAGKDGKTVGDTEDEAVTSMDPDVAALANAQPVVLVIPSADGEGSDLEVEGLQTELGVEVLGQDGQVILIDPETGAQIDPPPGWAPLLGRRTAPHAQDDLHSAVAVLEDMDDDADDREISNNKSKPAAPAMYDDFGRKIDPRSDVEDWGTTSGRLGNVAASVAAATGVVPASVAPATGFTEDDAAATTANDSGHDEPLALEEVVVEADENGIIDAEDEDGNPVKVKVGEDGSYYLVEDDDFSAPRTATAAVPAPLSPFNRGGMGNFSPAPAAQSVAPMRNDKPKDSVAQDFGRQAPDNRDSPVDDHRDSESGSGAEEAGDDLDSSAADLSALKAKRLNARRLRGAAPPMVDIMTDGDDSFGAGAYSNAPSGPGASLDSELL